jgi:long-subunit acyl-CoA synthetase (AMP-forming)
LRRSVGRLDDLFKLSNGETIVPAPIEGALLAHPLVKGAMVFGRGRMQIGVIVEPVRDKVDVATFRNEIWFETAPDERSAARLITWRAQVRSRSSEQDGPGILPDL